MGHPLGRTPAQLERLFDEAQLLHDRLLRVTRALTVTQDFIAETCERLAGAGGDNARHRQLEAERARAFAEECRRFAARLDELG